MGFSMLMWYFEHHSDSFFWGELCCTHNASKTRVTLVLCWISMRNLFLVTVGCHGKCYTIPQEVCLIKSVPDTSIGLNLSRPPPSRAVDPFRVKGLHTRERPGERGYIKLQVLDCGTCIDPFHSIPPNPIPSHQVHCAELTTPSSEKNIFGH